jgi:assimilatory nitrate reductase catalytic subunit
VLNTGRIRDQWHTMTRTGAVARLMSRHREPALEIHPADAERFGIEEAGLVRAESRHGTTVLPVRLSADQRRGEVFAPMHWSDAFCSSGPVDRLVGAAVDPVSGQPELKGTPIRVAPVVPLWRALLLRSDGLLPDRSLYWSRVPVRNGHAFDLAGLSDLPEGRESERWVRSLLGTSPRAELVIYADPARSTFRYASIANDRLESCLFVARDVLELPERDVVTAALGSEVTSEARLTLLSGYAESPDLQSNSGPTVCACYGVGRQTLCNAIAERGLTKVADIGNALGAGTNCGSCIPELKSILREMHAGLQSTAVMP